MKVEVLSNTLLHVQEVAGEEYLLVGNSRFSNAITTLKDHTDGS